MTHLVVISPILLRPSQQTQTRACLLVVLSVARILGAVFVLSLLLRRPNPCLKGGGVARRLTLGARDWLALLEPEACLAEQMQ